eukprot:6514035-Ditylum_brightwellii.AAC.1
MKRGEDPDCLFKKLSGLENQYNTTLFQISSEDLITTVLEKVPKEFGTILTCGQCIKGNTLTTVHLNEAMSQLYQTMNGLDKKDEEENEAGLIPADETVCFNCNKKGHMLFQCLLKKDKGKGIGGRRGKCMLCEKDNHATKDCFKEPRNTSNVPSWWRRGGKGDNGNNNNGRKGNEEKGMYWQEVEMILAATETSSHVPPSYLRTQMCGWLTPEQVVIALAAMIAW